MGVASNTPPVRPRVKSFMQDFRWTQVPYFAVSNFQFLPKVMGGGEGWGVLFKFYNKLCDTFASGKHMKHISLQIFMLNCYFQRYVVFLYEPICKN